MEENAILIAENTNKKNGGYSPLRGWSQSS